MIVVVVVVVVVVVMIVLRQFLRVIDGMGSTEDELTVGGWRGTWNLYGCNGTAFHSFT